MRNREQFGCKLAAVEDNIGASRPTASRLLKKSGAGSIIGNRFGFVGKMKLENVRLPPPATSTVC